MISADSGFDLGTVFDDIQISVHEIAAQFYHLPPDFGRERIAATDYPAPESTVFTMLKGLELRRQF